MFSLKSSEQTFRSGGRGACCVASNVTRVTVPHSSLDTSGRHPCARSELGVADEAINKNRVCLPPPAVRRRSCVLLNDKQLPEGMTCHLLRRMEPCDICVCERFLSMQRASLWPLQPFYYFVIIS